MLFNSYIFVLFFLPMALVLYYGLNRLGRYTMAKVMLVCMSLWFYAYFHVSYLFLIIGSVLFNYTCSKWLLCLNRKKARILLLTFGILVNLCAIFYFKYFNFFISNVNFLFHTSISLGEILMPLGISFFTFQQISYLVDSYKQETLGYTFLEYTLFVTFFPQLIAGPIVFHQEMIPQFREAKSKYLDQYMLAQGIWLFSIGIFKKVMIADVLGKGVDWGFTNSSVITGLEAALVSVLYSLQIYFDFSGYCDMACGLANMFGLELPLNFSSPYKSASILEFWQRWHITLTRFLRKYIYFPLGGSRKGTVRTLLNVMIVFLISGIWHGAAWTFILWGLLHGAASGLCRLFRKIWDKIPRIIGIVFTFVFVNLTWILFRAESISQARVIYSKLADPWELRISGDFLSQFDLLEFTYVEEQVSGLGNLAGKYPGIHLAIILTVAIIIVFCNKNCHEKKFVPNLRNAFASIVLLTWSVISFSELSAFLYFNF